MRWLGLAFLVACSGSGGDDKEDTTSSEDSDADADTDADSDTDADTDADTDSDTDFPSADLAGTVTDAAGVGVNDVALKLCRGLACRNGATDASGGFSFDDIEADWHSFEVVPPEGSNLATVLVPLVFEDEDVRDISAVLLTLDAATAMPASAMEVPAGEGLYITVSGDVLEPPLFIDPATEVAGIRVPEAMRPPVDDIAGTVVDMWFVKPFDHKATNTGLPVRFDNLWALPEASTLQVYVGSYDESEWLLAGTVTVSGTELTGDALLPLMSTILLVQP